MITEPDLFSDEVPSVKGMVHAGDPATSIEAAQKIIRVNTILHERVMEAFHELGPMTDEQLEKLPRFCAYGPSTIRKRRSELFKAGRLKADGVAVNQRGSKMLIWRVA